MEEPTAGIDNGLIHLANSMLDQLHVPNHVSRVEEISAAVFVLLYEGLCGEQLPDVIRQPKGYEDEVHNCQVVIDALSMDVLHTSLSHITGEEVAKSDRNAISNLLEIFSGLMEYILNKIESDISDADGDREVEFDDDPDAMTPDVIDDILERELGRSRSAQQREVEKRAHMQEIVGEQKERSPDRQSGQNRSIPAPAMWEKSERVKPDKPGHGNGRISRTDILQDSRRVADSRPTQDSRRVTDSRQLQDGAGHRSVPQRLPPPDNHSKSSVLETTESLIREGERLEADMLDTVPSRDRGPTSNLSHLYTQPTVDTTPEISPPKKHDSGRGIFDHVGMRPQPTSTLTNERPGTVPPANGVTAESRNTHQTITHHLYHHYSASRNRTGDRRIEDLPTGGISAAERLIGTVPSGVRGVIDVKSGRTTDMNYQDLPARGHYLTRPNTSSIPYDLSSSMPAAPVSYEGAPLGPGLRYTAPVSSEGAPLGPGLRYTAPAHLLSTNRDHRARDSTAVPAAVPNKSTSYENLTAFVEKTVKMSRDAVSPDRGTASTARDQLLSKAIRDRLVRIENESDEITQLAASLNLPQRRREVEQGRPLSRSVGPSSKAESPTKSQRKVSFLTEKSSDEDVSGRQRSAAIESAPDSPVKSSLRRYYQERSQKNEPPIRKGVPGKSAARRPSSRVTHKPPVPRGRGRGWRRRSVEKGYGSDGDVETLSDQLSDSEEDDGVRYPYSRRYDDLLLEDLEDDQVTRRNVEADKRVHFNDLLNKRGTDAVKDTQKHIQTEDEKARKTAEFLRQLYEHDLDDFKEELEEQTTKDRKTAKQKEQEYKKKVLTGPKTKSKVGKKNTGGLPPKPRPRAGVVKPKARRRSASASPTVGRRASPLTVGEQDDLFSMVYEEFPYLHLSSETWHELWRQGIQQIERLTRAQQEVKTRKSRGQSQLEEAERRQQILMNIMKKELAHTQRMREVKSRRDTQVSVKNKLHERRMQSARSRKYYDEYQVRSRSKMLKRRTKEEMIFKKLFRDGLDIQKERIKELRRYAKEQRDIQTKERQNDIDSMENYYRDQFDMLAESVSRERDEQLTREKAQAKVLEQMKKELRKKMEREIEDFQDQLFRDEDDTYFRQLDADRLRHELHMAKYHVKV